MRILHPEEEYLRMFGRKEMRMDGWKIFCLSEYKKIF